MTWMVARKRTAAVWALGLCTSIGAWAIDAQDLKTQSLAATCAHCHGTDGRAVAGQANARLAGQNKTQMLETLMAFRSGQRPATVMHQLTKGYTPEQLGAIAEYFSKQK